MHIALGFNLSSVQVALGRSLLGRVEQNGRRSTRLVGVAEKNPELVAEARKRGAASTAFFGDYERPSHDSMPAHRHYDGLYRIAGPTERQICKTTSLGAIL